MDTACSGVTPAASAETWRESALTHTLTTLTLTHFLTHFPIHSFTHSRTNSHTQSYTHSLSLSHTHTHTHTHTLSHTYAQTQRERDFLIHNLLVRIHLIAEMIWWIGLEPWVFEFSFFQVALFLPSETCKVPGV